MLARTACASAALVTAEAETLPHAVHLLADWIAVACRFQESIDACETVLALNPLHYAALSGKGLCHAGVKENGKAIECFKRALAINPFMSSVKNRLIQLERANK